MMMIHLLLRLPCQGCCRENSWRRNYRLKSFAVGQRRRREEKPRHCGLHPHETIKVPNLWRKDRRWFAGVAAEAAYCQSPRRNSSRMIARDSILHRPIQSHFDGRLRRGSPEPNWAFVERRRCRWRRKAAKESDERKFEREVERDEREVRKSEWEVERQIERRKCALTWNDSSKLLQCENLKLRSFVLGGVVAIVLFARAVF